MSLRYRVEYNEEGDVLDPQAWNANQNELTSEFNGYLDRDNLLPNTLNNGSFVTATFNTFHQVFSSVASALGTTSPVWVPVSGSTLNITCPQDCLFHIEWSGGWYWSAYTGDNKTEDAVAFRVTVDGAAAATSQYFGSSHIYMSTYLVAAVPVAAGPHVVQVEALVARVRHFNLNYADKDVTGTVTADARYLIVHERRR